MQHTDNTAPGSCANGAAQAESQQKSQLSAKSSPIFQDRTADKNVGQNMPDHKSPQTKKNTTMSTTPITAPGSNTEHKPSGIFAKLSKLPLVNYLTSTAHQEGDIDTVQPEVGKDEQHPNHNATDGKPDVANLIMNTQPYISPFFHKDMKLGELMFCIAAIYAHAKRHGIACRIPWSANPTAKALYGALNKVRIPYTIRKEINPIVYEEKSMGYTPIPEDIRDGRIKGYFHSPLYFEDMEDKIRKLFSPLVAEEKEPGTVGIHINVGEGSFQHSKFRLATSYYLLRATAHIPESVREVIVFSDTPAKAVALLADIPEYARFAFRLDHSEGVDMLRRMTEMENIITSNDAISWWAAWLSKPAQVITHNFWFNVNGDKLPDIPESTWIKL